MQESRELPIQLIISNRYQPRISFNDETIAELAQSIKENGLIQPISVRPVGRQYEIIAGERRFRAVRLLGRTTIPCLISNVDDAQLAEMALVENIQREDLSAIEEAKAFLVMLETQALTQEKIAAKIGMSQSAIANKIRLLQLPQSIQDAVSQRVITERHARAMLGLELNKQMDIFKKITHQNLNVRQTEALIQTLSEDKVKKPRIRGVTRNLQIAINTLNATILMIQKTGIEVESTQSDTPTSIEVVVRFKK
ncbi:MAG: ParB/RepB/Spo0J family partition protein [Erysipelotrichaceae bacterium]